ncbi:LEA type 2 family protein [Segetibacter koreensis]|uniref:LEA type 2 family protein n=1 Tax=Segetibacter koreensis TaxID=398037 RepID=UPI00035CAB2D|nr:LEA type 2 family protein [Segetibacter koreensis]
MKKLLPLLLVIIIIFCYSCKTPLAFQYRDLKNFHLDNFGLNKSRVSMDFVFFNPNSFPVDLKKVDCDVYLDSSYVGKFLLDTTMHIGGATEFTLPASLDVEMKNVLKNSLNLLMSNEVLIGARGTTRMGRGGFYLNIPFRYEGRQKLNIF